MTPTWPSNTRRYKKQYLLDCARGVPRHYVPVEEVGPHVDALIAAGASAQAIADVAGIGQSAVLDVHRRAQARCQQRTAQAILSVTIADVQARPHGKRDRTGAVRRVRALHALGWRSAEISAVAGIDVSWHIQGKGRISTEAHAKIVHAYDQLSLRLGPSRITAKRAATAGWPPPLAWDDDTIDDPTTKPLGVAKPRKRISLHLQDIEELALAGAPWSVAAARLGGSRNSIEQHLVRANRHDLMARFSLNSQGEYALAERRGGRSA